MSHRRFISWCSYCLILPLIGCSSNLVTKKTYFDRDWSNRHHYRIDTTAEWNVNAGITLGKSLHRSKFPISADTVFAGTWNGILTGMPGLSNVYPVEFVVCLDSTRNYVFGKYTLTIPYRIGIGAPDTTIVTYPLTGQYHEDSLFISVDTIEYGGFEPDTLKLRFSLRSLTMDERYYDEFPISFLSGDFIDSAFRQAPVIGHVMLEKRPLKKTK